MHFVYRCDFFFSGEISWNDLAVILKICKFIGRGKGRQPSRVQLGPLIQSSRQFAICLNPWVLRSYGAHSLECISKHPWLIAMHVQQSRFQPPSSILRRLHIILFCPVYSSFYYLLITSPMSSSCDQGIHSKPLSLDKKMSGGVRWKLGRWDVKIMNIEWV